MPIRTILLAAVLIPTLAFAQNAQTPPQPAAQAPVQPAAPQPAMDPAKAEILAKAPAIFYQLVAPGRRVDAVQRTMDGLVDQLDADRNGVIDAGDQKALDDLRAVNMRANKVERILRYDIHNTGKVTRADVEAGLRRDIPVASQTPAAMQTQVDAFMRADLNHDGVIDFDEMRTLSPDELRIPFKGPAEQVVALAPDGKSIPVKDVKARFGEFLRVIDANGDGTISEDEYKAIQPMAQTAMNAARITAPPSVAVRQPPAAAAKVAPKPAVK